MKTLFFLIVLALVASFVIWRIRKSDADAQLAQAEALELRKMQRREAVTTMDPVRWPTIIRAVSDEVPSEEKVPEPAMATIEFKPTEQPTVQH
jgi:hypothetical protein